jgi:hypothetical protein
MFANHAIAFSALRPRVQAQHGRSIAKSGCLVERAFRIEATCPTDFVLAHGNLLPQTTLRPLMLRNFKTLACSVHNTSLLCSILD